MHALRCTEESDGPMAGTLKAIYTRSRAKSWQALQDAVVSKFKLKAKKEVFKKERERKKAQELAKRLLGKSCILEYHRSNSTDQKATQESKEIIQRFGHTTQHWYWRDQSWQELWACCDGFHVQLRADAEDMGNEVFVGPGEVLDVCTYTDTQGDDLKCEKQYYMVVTFPKKGVLGIAAMESPTKLREVQDAPPAQKHKFWYQQLVELGIGTRETELMIQQKVQRDGGWTVCMHVICHAVLYNCATLRIHSNTCRLFCSKTTWSINPPGLTQFGHTIRLIPSLCSVPSFSSLNALCCSSW